jgi:hypothetical protein
MLMGLLMNTMLYFILVEMRSFALQDKERQQPEADE